MKYTLPWWIYFCKLCTYIKTWIYICCSCYINIFKLDDVEPLKEFILFKFEFILPLDDNILVPETVNEDKTEILSDVILLHVKSYAPFDDKVNEAI